MATDLEKLTVQLSADIRKFEQAFQRAVGVTNKQAKAIENRASAMAKRLDGIGRNAASGLIAPLSGIGAALGVREIVQYADAWTEAGNKIKAAATASGVQARSLNDLKDGANSARTGLSEYVDLYSKLIRSASGVAQNEQEIAAATNVVAKAFKAGGASASEQASGILQLGQALGSGVLQGDELRSLRENAPILIAAIAKEFDTNVAGLKALGAEGALTSDRIFKALLNAQADVEKQFRSTNATISDGITAVNNEFLAYVGNADSATGSSRALVQALLLLAENFKGTADTVVTFATVIAGALTGRAIAGAVVGLGNAVVALGAFLTALRAGTAVASTFTIALGPIGLLAGAAAAALLLMGNRTEQADAAAVQHSHAMTALKDAFAASQAGAKGAAEQFKKLSGAHIESAKSALADAEAHLQARQAIEAAGASTLPGFGEEAALAGSAQSFNTEAVAAALKDIEKRKAELKELQDFIANPNTDNAGFGKGTGAPPPKQKAVKATADSRFDQDIQGVRDRTAALLQEQQAIGLSSVEQEKRRMALELEQQALADLREEARRKGETDLESISLSPDQVAAIEDVSQAYAEQAESLRLAQDSFDQAKDITKDVFGGLLQDLRQGVNETDALTSALDRLESRLLDMALDAAINKLFSSLIGIGIGAIGGTPTPLGMGGIGHAAEGGSISGPGTGTSDSIPTMLSDGEYVIRASQAGKHRALLDAINNGTISRMASGGPVGRVSGGAVAGGGQPRAGGVVVNNYGREEVQARQRDDGTTEIIIGTVQQGMSQGRFNPTMRGTFGVGNNRIKRGSA